MRCLQDFLGHWRIRREIVQADGSSARLEGVACWQAAAGGARYEERGTLAIPGQGQFTAARRYFWDPGLAIFFEDGRFFHRVPAAGGAAEHFCTPDHYRVAYDFGGWPEWGCTWRVSGPRKAYTMTTRYRRGAA